MQRPKQSSYTKAERGLLLGSQDLRQARVISHQYRRIHKTISPLPSTRYAGFPICPQCARTLPLTSLGWHKSSIAYTSTGHRRYNQPFIPTNYGPSYVQGDVVGVGYRPRTGSVFFTRNGKKLDDVVHGLKTQNFFPTIGANGPCTVHVNFGQSGFVFIEANVKKWGLAPMTGSLAPPPPYGSEQGSILLEAGRDGSRQGQGRYMPPGHGPSRSGGQIRINPPMSPGPQRSPTEISLAQLAHIPSNEDVGEGTSRSAQNLMDEQHVEDHDPQYFSAPPPEYTSPEGSFETGRRSSEGSEGDAEDEGDERPLMRSESPRPPIPTYDAAVADTSRSRGRDGDHWMGSSSL